MGEFSVWHWLIVLAAMLVLFGSKRLPEMARSAGQSMRIFRSETRQLAAERDSDSAADSAAGAERADQRE